jgi:hypothetical protein
MAAQSSVVLLGTWALQAFLFLVPLALVYLARAQRRRHKPSARALDAVALAIVANTLLGWVLALPPVADVRGSLIAGLWLATVAVLVWKLALRRNPKMRLGETTAERLLPILITADLLILLMAWPALAASQAAMVLQ